MPYKPTLLGLTKNEISDLLKGLELPSYAANQVVDWIYKSNISSFDEMSNISKKNRDLLNDNFELGIHKPEKYNLSDDGTIKYLFKVEADRYVETALIPEVSRNTLCISTQIGCKMGCKFCVTGTQGFQGQLSVAEILNQLRAIPQFQEVTNIVFMGMGEPFDNLENLLKSLEILTSEYGFNISTRKITVSTIGIVPAIKRFLQESKCNLAISLHNPFDDERLEIMPIQNKYSIKEVVDTIKNHQLDKYRKVSFEYIVFSGYNDTTRHANEIARLLNKVSCNINLIRFHNASEKSLPPTQENSLLEFQKMLQNKGIQTNIRKSRGEDINAACGLLSTKAYLEKSENK